VLIILLNAYTLDRSKICRFCAAKIACLEQTTLPIIYAWYIIIRQDRREEKQQESAAILAEKCHDEVTPRCTFDKFHYHRMLFILAGSLLLAISEMP